ncbi:hypothetical protein MJN47_31030, partial [Salmonella enterica subsp. enterica serovar Lubbock]|nr:hypothetical protein [Salmonella enterica subsp. enterica serovar Lubbock]
LRRRADGRNDVESSIQEENLERRFRLAALRSERAELYHLRATCRVNRFDGYLADAEAWATTEADVDPDAVMKGYNEIFADTLPA